jgi:NAD(P)-dependent dehydrogenase (short-subunit alcohol dehydrogenase family)
MNSTHAPKPRVVLVTGGTKGIGRGIAEAFLAEGDRVIVCARSLPENLPAFNGHTATFVACDVREPEAIQAMLRSIIDTEGHIDIVVHNAGGSPAVDAATVSPRFHDGVIRLNFTAALHVAQAANAVMQQQNSGGVIVFIGSISGMRPSPGTAAYGAAKAAVISLTSSLAIEWAPRVRVVTVSPGLVRTEQSALHYGDEAGIAAVASTIPAGRMAEPADIAQACLFVSSDRANYMSGSNLLLHGGGEMPVFLQAANAQN